MSSTAPPASLTDALRDRYTVLRELGRGGMATVFLARDLTHDRRVALKVLRPELAIALGTARSEREIGILPDSIIPSFFRYSIAGLQQEGRGLDPASGTPCRS